MKGVPITCSTENLKLKLGHVRNVIKYGNKLHENIVGATKVISLKPDPSIAVWHIKSVEKQDNRWDDKGNFKVPDGENFYDTLM